MFELPEETGTETKTTFKFNVPDSNNHGIRNFNPGNLKFVGQRKAKGKAPDSDFAQFDSYETGFSALVDDINLKRGRNLTLKQFIDVYAPESDSNPVVAYRQYLADQLGTTEEENIANLDPISLAKYITKFETGIDVEELEEQAQQIEQQVETEERPFDEMTEPEQAQLLKKKVDEADSIGGLAAPWQRGIKQLISAGGRASEFLEFYTELANTQADAIVPDQLPNALAFAKNYFDDAASSIRPNAKTGKYARPIENINDFFDYKRIYNVIGEGLPLSGALITATLFNPAAGFAITSAIEGGFALDEMNQYEERTGEKIPELYKNTAPIIVGSINGALEMLSNRVNIGALRQSGVGRKLIGSLVGATVEGGTESLQETTNIVNRFVYAEAEPLTTEEVSQTLVQSFHAGFFTGASMQLAGNALGSLRRPPPEQYEIDFIEDPTTGEISPTFKTNAYDSPDAGKTFTEQELVDKGDLIPPYQRARIRYKAEKLAGLTPNEADAFLNLVDARARARGVEVNKYYAQNEQLLESFMTSDKNEIAGMLNTDTSKSLVGLAKFFFTDMIMNEKNDTKKKFFKAFMPKRVLKETADAEKARFELFNEIDQALKATKATTLSPDQSFQILKGLNLNEYVEKGYLDKTEIPDILNRFMPDPTNDPAILPTTQEYIYKTQLIDELSKLQITTPNAATMDELMDEFTKDFLGYISGQKTKHVTLQTSHNIFRNFLVDSMLSMSNEQSSDFMPTKEQIVLFDKLVKGFYVAPEATNRSLNSRFFDAILNPVFIERRFATKGAPQTGFHIKNIFSVREKEVDRATRLVQRVVKLVGKDNAKLMDILLAAESKSKYLGLQTKNERAAAALIRNYFDESKNELIALGGLTSGFKERMLYQLNERLQELTLSGKADQATQDAMADLMDTIDRLEDLDYVHIAIDAVFGKLMESNDVTKLRSLARELESEVGKLLKSTDIDNIEKFVGLKVDKIRKTLSLADIFENEAFGISKEDVNFSDIFRSYSDKFGKDVSLLRIRNAAVAEGFARARVSGTKQSNRPSYDADSTTTFFPSNINTPIFNGYEFNSVMKHWLDSYIRSATPLDLFRKALNYTKSMAFFNPIILPMYNVVQQALLGTFSLAHPIKSVRTFAQGLHGAFTASDDYLEAIDNGLSSTPFDMPWDQTQAKFYIAQNGGGVTAKAKNYFREVFSNEQNKNLLHFYSGLPFRVLNSLYKMSSDIAWTMEAGGRHASYLYLKESGISSKEAAQMSSLAMGDYAAVDPKVRRFLNTILFTPTYKLAMGKFLSESTRAFGSVLSGNYTQGDLQLAKVFLRIGAIFIATDMFLVGSLGFERDEWGRKYKKKVKTDFGPKEIVYVWSTPANLFSKYFSRLQNSFRPEVEQPLMTFLSQNQFELHPLYRTVNEVFFKNEDFQGQPITSMFDSSSTKAAKRMKYAVNNIFGIKASLSGIEDLTIGKETGFFDDEGFGKSGRDAFEKEFGELAAAIANSTGFTYVRADERIRQKQNIDKLMILIQEDTGLRGIMKTVSGLNNKKELDKLLNDLREKRDPRLKNFKVRINMLIDEFEKQDAEASGLENFEED